MIFFHCVFLLLISGTFVISELFFLSCSFFFFQICVSSFELFLDTRLFGQMFCNNINYLIILFIFEL
ncbi:unnamed protein product [Meloidogyne enterolobii]|uniref:Uncharacterized protein n=1 Tax=Meloidogyne enterolobii TaxID=390850 RepID=A0ACB0YHG0_MELEN